MRIIHSLKMQWAEYEKGVVYENVERSCMRTDS